jgi:hypothetical protein
MKYNLINTDNYLLVVDDSEIKEGDWIKWDNKVLRAVDTTYLPITKKIMAHAPLNNSPILEGAPLLPPLEDDVEKLASKHANLKSSIHDYDENYFNSHGVATAKGFISGYNKSREKYKFTEEDVRYLIMHSFLIGVDRGHYSKEIEDRIIQSLQQSKLPIAFECEMEYIGGDINDSDDFDERDWGVKTIINSEGRTEWVGKYIYN